MTKIANSRSTSLLSHYPPPSTTVLLPTLSSTDRNANPHLRYFHCSSDSTSIELKKDGRAARLFSAVVVVVAVRQGPSSISTFCSYLIPSLFPPYFVPFSIPTLLLPSLSPGPLFSRFTCAQPWPPACIKRARSSGQEAPGRPYISFSKLILFLSSFCRTNISYFIHPSAPHTLIYPSPWLPRSTPPA